MRRFAAPLFALFCIICVSSGSLQAAAIIFSDNFTEDTPGPNATLTGWSIIQSPTEDYTGTVDLLGGGPPPYYANTVCTGGQAGDPGSTGAGGTDPCVDLVGSGPIPTGAFIEAGPFTFQGGVTYSFTFEIAGSQRQNSNTVTAGFWNGTSLPYFSSSVFTLPSGQPFELETVFYTPTNTTSAYIFFDNSSNEDVSDTCSGVSGPLPCGYMGALVENVSLAINSPEFVTPEPGTLVMFSFGLLGLGVYALRRNAAGRASK
jgi:PEP-CTERM motif